MIEDTYGLKTDDLLSAASNLADALNCKFTHCENDARGGDYFRFDRVDGKNFFLLQKNFIAEEGLWKESEFQEWPLLLYANYSTENEAITVREKLLSSGAALLRSEAPS